MKFNQRLGLEVMGTCVLINIIFIVYVYIDVNSKREGSKGKCL